MTSFWQGSLRQSLESKDSLAGSQEEDRAEYTETVVSSVELLCFQPCQIQISIFISKSPPSQGGEANRTRTCDTRLPLCLPYNRCARSWERQGEGWTCVITRCPKVDRLQPRGKWTRDHSFSLCSHVISDPGLSSPKWSSSSFVFKSLMWSLKLFTSDGHLKIPTLGKSQ